MITLPGWVYAVGSFAEGQRTLGDKSMFTFFPVGTFSTGQHGPAARHRREFTVEATDVAPRR